MRNGINVSSKIANPPNVTDITELDATYQSTEGLL